MIFSVEKKQSSIKRNRKKLRKEMIKKENFHINDLIDYEKFLKLYQLYGHKLSESEFASSFLDLSINDLYNLKKNRCKVLKKEEIDDSEIISLKLKMIKELNLKSGQSLSYEEIEELYNNTETILPLILFAEKILDVSSHSLSTIKNNSSKKATIFNNTEKEYFSEEPLEQLIQKIKKLQIEKTKKNQNLKDTIALDRNLHIGDSITSTEFSELYEIYGKNYYTNYEFAREILGLSEGKARNIINKKIDSIQIWNNENVSLEYLLKLRENIIQEENLHIRDKIQDYQEFKKLFEKYSGILSEKMFATEILDIPLCSYKNLKGDMFTAGILTDIDIPNDFFVKQREEIIKNENVYNGLSISYDEFLELYKKYGFVVWDTDFATKILDISQGQFGCLKNGTYTRARILSKISDQTNRIDIKKLRNIVIKENNLHIEDSISGKTFTKLYDKYGFGISKKDFATKILDIKEARLNCILRNEKDNAIILRNEILDKAFIDEIRKDVFRNSGYNTSDMIDYKEFKELYQKYGRKLSEYQFAENILYLTNSNFNIIKEKKDRKTKIFANLKLSDAYIATLKSKIVDKHLLYYKQNITPQFFKKIYSNTRTVLSESEFAMKILEISRQVYYKACISGENDTFRILSVSGSMENKPKFEAKQSERIQIMLGNGSSYTDILASSNLLEEDLKEKIKNNSHLQLAKSNYVLNIVRNNQNAEEEMINLLGITDEDLEIAKEKIEQENEFLKLQKRCFDIVDDMKETKNSKKIINDYINSCKKIYEKNLAKMPYNTLEILNSALEYTATTNIEDIKFFIQACITKTDFYKANNFITYSMQTPDINIEFKKNLQELRQHVRHSIKKYKAVQLIYSGVDLKSIRKFTDLSETEILKIAKNLRREKEKI